MMSKPIKGKLKSIFSKKGNSPGTLNERPSGELIITKDIIKEISNTQNVLHRVRFLKELGEVVISKILEQHEIEALLQTTSDLLDESIPAEGRQAVLQFLIKLTQGQYEQLKILRSQLFRVVVEHNINDDLQYRISLLKVLTDDGKDITYCETIGAFLDSFMEEALESSSSVKFLHFLTQFIHYNSSFLDYDIVSSIVQKACEFCNNTNGEKDIESCLQLLDATVRYGGLPPEGLLPLIETLCRTVNIDNFCQPSWKLMRNLIGTKLGHTAVFMMCKILEDNNQLFDTILLRGAVFFIGMSIWGSKRVSTLTFQPIHVLTSLKIALQSNHHLVAFEVMLSLRRLVKKYGADQEYVTWDIILDIIETVWHMLEKGCIVDSETQSARQQLHTVLTSIENLYSEGKFYGSAEKFFKILTSCAKDRPESIANLLKYYEEKIDPINEDWLEVFENMLDNYLVNETRSEVRVKALEVIENVYVRYRHGYYEVEILSLVLPKYLTKIVLETGVAVRMGMAKLLVSMLAVCTVEKYAELLEITNLFLSYICNSNEESWGNLEDIELTVDALIAAFKKRLFDPTNIHVGSMFKILIKHINDHYNCNVAGSVAGGNVRRKIFMLLLSLRANSHHFIGLAESDGQYGESVKYSVHVIFKPNTCDESVTTGSGGSESYVVDCDFQMEFEAILKCLKNELNWLVLDYVLKNLTRQLQNKNLYLYCKCKMNKLCSTLCILVKDKMYLNNIQNCPPNFGVSELRNLIFPILSTLSTYHDYLVRDKQRDLVKCIELGLLTHSAHTCVSCLTVCILEMQQIVMRFLPSILVKLSQISPTKVLSIPILQFLSTLKEIPLLYKDFIEEQYMCIFAMALPYTDCKRFSQYIVTIAYQVIADWFTRCRLIYRKGFVSLIAKALKGNQLDKSEPSKSQDLHKEMTEVCLDMMARYTFSSAFFQPNRSALVDSLLSHGISYTWLIGNMLVTITTSAPENRSCQCMYCQHATQLHDKSKDVTNMQSDKEEFVRHNSDTTSRVEQVSTKETLSENNDDIYGRSSTNYEINKVFNQINVVDGKLDEYESPCDEEGCEPTALVAKLMQQLEEKGNVFSPSQKLMFSRQASRAKKSAENEGGEHDEQDFDDESSESEEELGKNVLMQQETYRIHHEHSQASLVDCEEDRLEVANNQNTPNEPPPADYHDKPPTQSLKPSSADPSFIKQHILEGQCQSECGGWAEVLIQRPTGKTSWVIRLGKKESVGDVTLSELLLLTKSMEGSQIQDRLGPFLKPVSEMNVSDKRNEKPVRSSSESSKSSSEMIRPRRRFSTGSIDDTIVLQMTENAQDTFEPLSANQQPEKIEKRPLTKSFSQPNHNNQPFRRRSSSVANDRRGFKSAFVQPSPSPKKVREEKGEERSWCPNFVFLQLFYSSIGTENSPVLLETSEAMDRALMLLDRIPSCNTHKFGVLYVDKGQEQNETEILANTFGSVRYTDFISELGNLISLEECSKSDHFFGGLSNTGEDGRFAYIWRDDTTQVVFHVATLMPNNENDRYCNSKKLHIGNNFVTIIYDNTKHGYVFGTIKCQFNLAEIVIRPLEYNSNVVTVRWKNKQIYEKHVISDKNLPLLVRQLAIHTNMALVSDDKNTTNAFASNWLERLRQIKRIKNKAQQQHPEQPSSSFDFSFYT